jgi:hypothetical protein
VRQRSPDPTLRYLQIARDIVYEPDVMFSNGVGYAGDLDIVPLAEALDRGMVDFDVLYRWMNWPDPEVQQRRRAAELCEIRLTLAVETLSRGAIS